MSLLDEWMQDYDVASQHSISIPAPIPLVWRALLSTDFFSHPVTRLLLILRSVPSVLASPRSALSRLNAIRSVSPDRGLRTLLSDHFVLLEERAPSEIVLGLTGRFWSPSGGLVDTDPSLFRTPVPEGLARAGWTFSLHDLGDGTTRLSTETRVRCGDTRSLRAFRRYWFVVRPFSGVLRRMILGRVRQRALELVAQVGKGERPERPSAVK